MSWLSELADKAENLLNKIDQNAAAVLQEIDNINVLKFPIGSNGSESNKLDVSSQVTIKSDLNFESNSSLKAVSLTKAKTKTANTNESASKDKQSLRQSSSFAHFTSGNQDEFKSFSDTSSLKDAPVTFNLVDVSQESSPRKQSIEHLNKTEDFTNTNSNADDFVTMENEMLKNEISIVNNEVSLLISKVKSAEKVAEESVLRINQVESKYSQVLSENQILQSKVCELESQIRIAGGFLADKPNSEENLQDLRNEVQDLQKRITQLELTEFTLNTQKTELESNLLESQNKCQVMEERLEKTKTELANIQVEWKNYKIRVNNTLSMKEKVIEELGGGLGPGSDELINNFNSQIAQLKLERDEAVEEVSKVQNDLEEKRQEIESLEARINNTERQISILKDAFRQEKVAKEMAEHNVTALNKEIKSLQVETANQISTLRTKLREHQSKESDHTNIQSTSNNQMHVAENGDERIRLLTQALVAKQAALESIMSDRNALRLQLENTETKYRSDLIKMKNNQPRIINVNDTDDVKARFPLMMQESPWDSHLSRGAKKVYSTLDSFSVRVGVFLRRNPVARIFIISYMILLHLWVCIVLFSYTPEVRTTATYTRPN